MEGVQHMASYDRLVKYLADKFQAAVSPLSEIIQNQEIIIAQNKQIINLITRAVDVRPEETEAAVETAHNEE